MSKRKLSTDVILTLPNNFFPEALMKFLPYESRSIFPEWCGIFYDDNGNLKSIHNTIGKQKNCQIKTKKGYTIMWHTHPDKFYPSFLDLRFLYISNCYRLSIIYSTVGTWILKKIIDVNIDKNNLTLYTLCELKMYKISENGRKLTQKCLEFIKNEYIPILRKVFGIKAIFSQEHFSKQIILEDINPLLLTVDGVDYLDKPDKKLIEKLEYHDLTLEQIDSLLKKLNK